MPLTPYRRRFKTPEQKTDANGMVMLPEGEPLNFDSLRKFLEQKKQEQTQAPLDNSDLGSGFVERPKLYDEQGNLNPKYDSSIGADMMTGLGRGVQVGLNSGRSSLFGIASALGGLAGGAFSKNIAGADKYHRDVQMADSENNSVYQQTEARRRIEALRSEEDNRKQQLANQQTRNTIYQLRASSLNNSAKIKELDKFVQTANLPPEARAEIARQRAELSGIDLSPEDVDENYGLKFTQVNAGDRKYNVDQFGTFRSAIDSSTGNPITNMTFGQQLSDLASLAKLNSENPADKQTMEQAIEQAGKIMSSGQLPRGLKPQQAASLQVQLANKILQNNKSEKPQTTDRLTIGGQTYFIDLTNFPVLNKGTQQPATSTSSSPFMQDENLYDGVPEGAVQDVKKRFTNPADIQNAISDTDKEIQNPKNDPKTKSAYVEYRKALEGRMKEVGGTYDATDSKPASVSNTNTFKMPSGKTYTQVGEAINGNSFDLEKIPEGGIFKDPKTKKLYRKISKTQVVEVN